MRPWRKVYTSVTASERLGRVSDQAALLFFLLLPIQDDAGRVPWHRTFARQITASRDWSWSDTETYADELVSTGLVLRTDHMLEVRRGAELNGTPTSGSEGNRTPKFYPTHGVDSTSTYQVLTESVPSTYQRRGEESRGDKNPPVSPPLGIAANAATLAEDFEAPTADLQGLVTPVKPSKPSSRSKSEPTAVTVVDVEYKNRMVAHYASRFTADEVLAEIAAAMGYSTYRKWDDKQLYVSRWLGRWARERTAERDAAPHSNGHKPELTLEDFPEPEPPKGAALDVWQAHSAWEDRRERWWQMNKRKQRVRSG